jgi:phosphoribosylformimino-5-aminoimidazole carboxamide ribonucleotide (ProFAR) isomerase
MGRKVVQLVQGKRKALELPDPIAVLEKFKDYPQIQVIDLDGAMGHSSQADIVRDLCRRKPCRVGGGVRSLERALQVEQDGAYKIIVGSSAFTSDGINIDFLRTLSERIAREKLMIGVDCFANKVAIHGWKETLPMTPAEVLPRLEPFCSEFLCTYIDAEGKLQGTDLEYFRSLRAVTALPITAAGGITTDDEIQALEEMGMNAALGMSIYRKTFPELFPESQKI